MRRILAMVLLALALVPAAHAQPYSAGTLQALVQPLARYPDQVIVEVAGAAADPRLIDSISDPALRTFVLEHPDWAAQLASAFALQENELWQAIDLQRGGPPAQVVYAPPLLAASAPVVVGTYFVPQPQVVVVQRPARVHARTYVQRPVFVGSFRPAHGPVVSRNGPPSPAAQIQQANTAAYLARQNQRPAFTSNQPIPEAARRPIVQQHYPQHWQRKSRP